MPLSEFLKMARGNLESGQEKASTATDLSSCHKDDLVELVWENGQMMMQGLSSSRAKKSPTIGNPSTSKIGKLGVMDSMLPLSMPADELDLAEEDEMVPWLSYSEDYRSSTLPEISRSVPTHNIVNSEQRNVAISDIVRSNTSDNAITAFRDSIKSLKMQKRNVPDSSSSLLNFSHFQRSRTLLEPNPRNIAEGMAISGSSAIEEKRENKEKENAASSSSRVTDVPYDNLFRDGTNKNDESVGRFTGVKATKEIPIACSSVCSGSSGERASSDHPRALKRKTRDSEDSDFPSEDVDEESGGVKSGGPAHGVVGSKRSRAAEVHNLSERRRRDRINEKMRALQELIPNCNKVDKASMLDEAIEYLKTLQLQVQMMSMGAGLYGTPMMYPSHMPHFSPMGLGMGMGFGMEMNGGPIYPTMQGAHFSSPLGNPGRGVPMSVPRAPSVPGNLTASSAAGLNITTAILDSRNQVYTDNSQNKSGI